MDAGELAPEPCGQGGTVAAQAWPTAKPVTIVISYPAGGDTDAIGRVYAEKLAARIGQNTPETNWKIVNVLPRVQDMSHDDGLFVEQLNSAMARPPEAEQRLREFVDGKAKPLARPGSDPA